MAARNNPSKGAKPDKLMRDALLVAINREGKDEDGRKYKYYTRIAANLVIKAAHEADLMAIKEIFDRVDGKPTQMVESGENLTDAIKNHWVKFGDGTNIS